MVFGCYGVKSLLDRRLVLSSVFAFVLALKDCNLLFVGSPEVLVLLAAFLVKRTLKAEGATAAANYADYATGYSDNSSYVRHRASPCYVTAAPLRTPGRSRAQ